MADRYHTPNEQSANAAGVPYAGGKLAFYITGTSTPTNTYSDSALVTPNANPVILDSAGRAGNIFLDPTVTYKVVHQDSAGNSIWSADPVTSGAAVATTFTVYAGNPNGYVAGNAGTVGGVGASVVYDITNKLIYVCTTTGIAAAAVWTSPSLSLTGKEDLHTATYLVVTADNGRTQVGNSGSAITFNLTAAATLGAGFILPVKNIGAGALTIDANAAETIDGALVLVLFQYEDAILYCNGSTWRILSIARVSIVPPTGRLSLATATPVVTSDQATKTTIFWCLYGGNQYPWFNGTYWTVRTIAELSLALDSNAGHTGYHQSGKNFDLFLYNNAGTDVLASGPAWTNDTTRAQAVSQVNGVYVNTLSMTARSDASASTLTVAASQGTYVGTFRASADGQTQALFGGSAAGGTAASILLWNLYNQVPVSGKVKDSTNSWVIPTGTQRSSDNSTAMRVSWVAGLSGYPMSARFDGSVSTTNAAGAYASLGVGLDTTALTGIWVGGSLPVSNIAGSPYGHDTSASIGFHFFQAIEYNPNGAGTTTGYGNAGVALQLATGLRYDWWF